MKRTMTLALLGLACLLIINSVAQAGYRDGMNQYEYVRSNPTVNRDPSGLWTVHRDKNQPWATACCDKLWDTWDSLAEESTKLAPDEYTKWVRTSKSGQAPATPVLGTEYQVPNEVVITAGDVSPWWWNGLWATKIESRARAMLERGKYHVVSNMAVTNGDVKEYLSRPSIAGWIFVGHAGKDGDHSLNMADFDEATRIAAVMTQLAERTDAESWRMYAVLSAAYEQMGAGMLTPNDAYSSLHHKLGLVMTFACYSDASGPGRRWRDLTAKPYGRYFGYKGNAYLAFGSHHGMAGWPGQILVFTNTITEEELEDASGPPPIYPYP